MLIKSKIRTEILEKRKALEKSDKKLLDEQINQNLIGLFKSCGLRKESKILGYYPSLEQQEVDVREFLQFVLESGAELYLPKIQADSLQALRVLTLEELKPNKFQILEPSGKVDGSISSENFDLILVPGVAFDDNKNRVGYGKGYYDKFLKTVAADSLKVGVAYEFQKVERIPSEKFDVAMDRLVTESVAKSCRI